MEKTLKQKVVSWLESEGYPLEMNVASVLRQSGYEVHQGVFYEDPETKVPREIDIIGRSRDVLGKIEVTVIVECKKSIDKPWVVFTSEEHSSGKNKLFTYCIMTDQTRSHFVEKLFGQNPPTFSWFDAPPRTGYGMAVAFAKSDVDPSYKAVLSAMKASIAMSLQDAERIGTPDFRFYFPMIVLEGKLFESYHHASGKIIVEEIEEAVLTYYHEIGGEQTSSLRVVTKDRFETIAQDAWALSQQLIDAFKGDVETLKEMKRKKRREMTS